MSNQIDFAGINAAALDNFHSFLKRLLPNGRVEGNEYVAINPKRGDSRPGSFKINLKTDFATRESGGDPIDLWAYVNGNNDMGVAAREVAAMVGVPFHVNGAPHNSAPASAGADRAKDQSDGSTLLSPVPRDAPELDVVWRVNGEWRQPNDSWVYGDAEGRVLGYACRWNTAEGDKHYSFATLWRRENGKLQWCLKHLPAPRPLLNLHELLTVRPNAPVLVVEGEKAARAAYSLFSDMAVTTSIGGASNASHADWSPAAVRDITIWPDADEPGAKYAQEVARLAHSAGARSIAIVNVGAMPPKWDLADPMPNGADIYAMLADAVPWQPDAATPPEGSSIPQPAVRLISAADIKPESICWLWDGYLAKRKLHIIAGKPSAGKTTVALDFAATISRGRKFPDKAQAQPGNVLIWSGEDGRSDTLVPRLMAANADLSRIHFVTGSENRAFDPAVDMPLLTQEAERLGDVALLILDPIVSAVQGDSHKNAEVRRGLQPVVDFCERVGCAAIGITHLSKGTQGQDPIDRITGSLAFGAVSRIALLATREETGNEPGPGRRVITRIKSNIGPDGGGFFYEIKETLLVPGIVTSKVEWVGIAEGSARDIIGCAEESSDPEKKSALDEAIAFLRATLAEKALPATEVISAAEEIGIARRTLDRARSRAGVKAFKQSGYAGKGHWMWWLPDPSKTNSSAAAEQDGQDCQPGEFNDFGNVGNHDDQVDQGCQSEESGNLGQQGDQGDQGDQECQTQNVGNLGNVGHLARPEGENGGIRAGEPIVEVNI